MQTRKNGSIGKIFMIAVILCLFIGSASAQENDKPIDFSKMVQITVTNPISDPRNNEPVVIQLMNLQKYAPDFNTEFYRIIPENKGFEPVDIPSQIRTVEGTLFSFRDLVFQVDLGPNETKTFELWYNPKGAERLPYPTTTQSFDKWYRLGTNIAWENEIIAYRSYSGVVDFFAKSYRHLRIHNLPPDSYHHERFWGLDPYMIGEKPGLCGVKIVTGSETISCYGNPDSTDLSFIHKSIEGGPVCTGAIIQVIKSGELIAEEVFTLFSGRHENRVMTVLPESRRSANTRIHVGMQTFGNMPSTKGDGYIAFRGRPVEEYGTISTALVWPGNSDDGLNSVSDGDFAVLKPDGDGRVAYMSVALWNRASAEQPASDNSLIGYVSQLKKELDNPVKIEITKVK